MPALCQPLWLSVRGQRPYQGPTPTALLALTVIVAAALAITVVLVGRAASGVGGSSARQRRVSVLASILGFAGLFTLEAGLAHAGASRSVLAVYGAAAPLLLTGVIIALGAAAAQDWTAFGLGTPGNLITHLRKLEEAEYVTTVKSGRGVTARTAISITRRRRSALDC